MAKKKSYQPQESLVTRLWRGSGMFRGPVLSAAGIALFVTGGQALQIGGMVLMLIGGWQIGQWYSGRQKQREAEKVIQRKWEKKHQRKQARADQQADEADEEDS